MFLPADVLNRVYIKIKHCRKNTVEKLTITIYSTVTDLAKLRGLSTSVPRIRAV